MSGRRTRRFPTGIVEEALKNRVILASADDETRLLREYRAAGARLLESGVLGKRRWRIGRWTVDDGLGRCRDAGLTGALFGFAPLAMACHRSAPPPPKVPILAVRTWDALPTSNPNTLSRRPSTDLRLSHGNFFAPQLRFWSGFTEQCPAQPRTVQRSRRGVRIRAQAAALEPTLLPRDEATGRSRMARATTRSATAAAGVAQRADRG